MRPRTVDGIAVEECGLCGHLQGDPDAVLAVLERRAAAECDVPVELFGLVQELDTVPGVRVDRAISIVPGGITPPAVFFGLHGSCPLEVLDRLARTLTLARRRTSTLWTVEATHQGRLLFVLRPRLQKPVGDVGTAELAALFHDARVLRDALRRDRRLPWWELPDPVR